MSKSVLLCAAKRSATGSFQGALSSTPAPQIAARVIRAVVEQSNIAPTSIDQVILGCVLSAGLGQAPARQATLGAGLPNTVQSLTINKVCSSGLRAVMLAADSIALGHAQAIVAGGMENMSRAPYILPSLRAGARMGHTEAKDSMIFDALWDVYNDFHMGNAGELCAKKFSFSREAQDEFAAQSYEKARAAIAAGHFTEEIVELEVSVGKEVRIFSQDEQPARGDVEKMKKLRPAFSSEGSITAGNASPVSDGAAAMLVCTAEFAEKNQLEPLAKVVSQGWAAQEPEWFTTAPIAALKMALSKASLPVEAIDLFEINEAFAAVAMGCAQELSIPAEKLNCCGGAIALGHPIGASGAKILTTLLYALKRRGGRYGAVGICNGGGEATALVVESLTR